MSSSIKRISGEPSLSKKIYKDLKSCFRHQRIDSHYKNWINFEQNNCDIKIKDEDDTKEEIF